MLQEVLEADEKEAAVRFPGRLSPSPAKPSSSVAGVQKHHTCEKCGTSIVTQAVRIADERYRHPECYTCTDCGLNLKMRGHFWAGEEMFCEKHAQERYQGPGSAPHATVSPSLNDPSASNPPILDPRAGTPHDYRLNGPRAGGQRLRTGVPSLVFTFPRV
ncbi:hypothetical protein ANANG_G00190560 [Anguilla anguilla]|uniref:LIM zinc-binding domain-containing protein n=1 Tax=Anguilla anguilla TaxID=7936 RepID=A0A9D3M2U1_ANGAN|nr:hypothetical protein ANANG_G00190560 [Anguilla anguilla]